MTRLGISICIMKRVVGQEATQELYSGIYMVHGLEVYTVGAIEPSFCFLFHV